MIDFQLNTFECKLFPIRLDLGHCVLKNFARWYYIY